MPFRLRLLLQDGMHFLHFLQEVPAHSLISPDVPQRYWYGSALLRQIRIPHGFPVPIAPKIAYVDDSNIYIEDLGPDVFEDIRINC
jgi:hypothetical protein